MICLSSWYEQGELLCDTLPSAAKSLVLEEVDVLEDDEVDELLIMLD